MKLLPINQTKFYKSPYQTTSEYQPAFRSKAPLDKLGLSMFKGLDKQLAEQLSNPQSRNILMGILLAGASYMTKLLTGKDDPAKVAEAFEQLNQILNSEEKENEPIDKTNAKTEEQPATDNNLTDEKPSDDVISQPEENKQDESKDVKSAEESHEPVKETMEQAEAKPEQEESLKISYKSMLQEYPELLDLYVTLKVSNGKGEQTCDEKLASFEDMLNILDKKQDNELPPRLFDALTTEYTEVLDEVLLTLASGNMSESDKLKYLYILSNAGMAKEDIVKWSKYPYLDKKEFILISGMREKVLKEINHMKKVNHIRTFSMKKPMTENKKRAIFSLMFYPETELSNKLLTIARFHELIYGQPIPISRASREFNGAILKQDIIKNTDNDLEPTFNFIKYIYPESLGEYAKLTSDDVFCLTIDSPEHKKLKEYLLQVARDLNTETPKFQNMVKVLNNKEIFDTYMGNRHAVARFVTRYVLRDNSQTTDLEGDCRKLMNIFEEELGYTLSRGYGVQNYNYQGGNNPYIFLDRKSLLGPHVKISLASDGRVHTMFSKLMREDMKVSPLLTGIVNDEDSSEKELEKIYAEMEGMYDADADDELFVADEEENLIKNINDEDNETQTASAEKAQVENTEPIIETAAASAEEKEPIQTVPEEQKKTADVQENAAEVTEVVLPKEPQVQQEDVRKVTQEEPKQDEVQNQSGKTKEQSAKEIKKENKKEVKQEVKPETKSEHKPVNASKTKKNKPEQKQPDVINEPTPFSYKTAIRNANYLTDKEKQVVLKCLKTIDFALDKNDLVKEIEQMGSKTGRYMSADDILYFIENTKGMKKDEQLNVLKLFGGLKNENIDNIGSFIKNKKFVHKLAANCVYPNTYAKILAEFGMEKTSKFPQELLIQSYSMSDGNMDFVSDMINGFNPYELHQILKFLSVRFSNKNILDYSNVLKPEYRDSLEYGSKAVKEMGDYKKVIYEDGNKSLHGLKTDVLKQLGAFGFVNLSTRPDYLFIIKQNEKFAAEM